MKVSTIISVILYLKLCPMKRMKDGTFKLDLFDGMVLVHAVLYMIAVVTYFALDLMEDRKWITQEVVVLIFKVITLTGL